MNRYLLLAVIVSVGFIFLLQFPAITYPGKSDFASRKSALESLVNHILKMELPPEERFFFTCDPDLNPTTLRPCGDSSKELHNVSAVRLNDGRLVVSIITTQLGHRGMYGYVYADGQLATTAEIGPDSWSGEETSIKVAADFEWWVDVSLPGNWWAVSNRLN